MKMLLCIKFPGTPARPHNIFHHFNPYFPRLLYLYVYRYFRADPPSEGRVVLPALNTTHSGDTIPCKVTPVILHGVVSQDYVCLERPSGVSAPDPQRGINPSFLGA